MNKVLSTDSDKQERLIQPEMAVGDLVVRYPQTRECLEKLGIDYCCGGKIPLNQAVAAAGLELPSVLTALEETLVSQQKNQTDRDWNIAPLSELADHILDKHHTFTKEQLIRLDSLLTKVEKAHGAQHADMLGELRRVFNALRAELDTHLLKEEQILFPAIKGIDAFIAGKAERPFIHCGSVGNPIQQMEHEHESAGRALVDLREISDNYQLPSDGCQTFAALYDGLQDIEADLHEHIHLENNILFPKSMVQEASIKQ